MSELEGYLIKKYGYIKRFKGNKFYEIICAQLTREFKFNNDQYYQDRTALLRHAIITKEIYEYGINNIRI
jgi:hypothetical protein